MFISLYPPKKIRYANGLLKVANVDKSRVVIKSLLEKYRATAKATGQNVVHIVHETAADAPVFTTGTPLADEFDELKPLEGEKVGYLSTILGGRWRSESGRR